MDRLLCWQWKVDQVTKQTLNVKKQSNQELFRIQPRYNFKDKARTSISEKQIQERSVVP